MNCSSAGRGAGARCERRGLLSELFHALNQPLTTLHCALELALQRPHREAECRHTLEAALLQAENVTRLTSGIRELLEADEPGDHGEVVALDAAVLEAVGDWLPVAEAAQIALLPQNLAACPVNFEPQRLRQALFRLLESVLHCASAGATVTIELTHSAGEVCLRITTLPGNQPRTENSSSLGQAECKLEVVQRRLGLAIAGSIFDAAGASLVARDKQGAQALEIRLARAAGGTPRRDGGPCTLVGKLFPFLPRWQKLGRICRAKKFLTFF